MVKFDVSQNELKQQALRIYFSVLLADQQQELLKTTQNTLKTHLERVHRAIRRGMHLPVDSTLMRVEMIKLDEQIARLEERRRHAVLVLVTLTDSAFTPDMKLALPEYEISFIADFQLRPDMQLLHLQRNQMEAM